MITALLVIAILVFLIVAHEFGHFIAAKLSGVKVQEFGVGYPPRAFSFGTIGDTEYTLNWIPFGGFVRLFGDEGEAEHGRGSLVDAPRWKQALILVAGVTANAVVAWMLFASALHLGVPQAVDVPPPGLPVQLIVTDIIPGSPASSAGIEPGDEITGVTDAQGTRIVDAGLTPDSVVAFVSGHAGKSVLVSYKHKGIEEEAAVTPAQGVLTHAAGQPALGIALVLVATQPEPWADAALDALYETRNAFEMVGGNLWELAREALHGAPDLSQVVGPVGIVSYVGEASQNGFGSVLLLAALISVNLAIINLIPIPALDGGRLFVLIIETIAHRPAPRLIIQILNMIGIALIILLMLVVTYHDIARLVV
jgi:regulator of sigma E protease